MDESEARWISQMSGGRVGGVVDESEAWWMSQGRGG